MFQQLNPFINKIIEKQEAVHFSSRNFKKQDKSCNHNAAMISNDLALALFSQRLKFEIAEVMTEIEQLTCIGERLVTGAAAEMKLAQLYNPSTLVSIKSCCPLS